MNTKNTFNIIDTLLPIIKIESIIGNEKPLCDFIQEIIGLRLRTEAVTISRINNSLIVIIEKDPNLPTIGLVGHLDTVPGQGYGNDVKVTDDRIIGLGASDMKGGVGIMLGLLTPEIIHASRFNLQFVFYEAEEGPHKQNGLHPIFKQTPKLKDIDLAFVLEPTNNTLHLGCMGSINATVTFKGKRAHSARPWQGENAIQKAGPFLTRMASLEREIVKFGDLEFYEVASITTANAGDANNIVPEIFSMNANIRFAPGKTKDDALNKLKALVNGEAKIDVNDISPSCTVPEKNSILDEFQKRFSLETNPKQAYTDVALFSQHGIDAINFGPGLTAQAHQVGEYILIDDLEKCFEIYRSFICES